MTSRICEYLWRGLTVDDNNRFMYNLRHKTRVLSSEQNTQKLPPLWNYDGSSTMQASTQNSVVHLIPVKTYGHPDKSLRDNGAKLVLCATSSPDDTILSTIKEIGENEQSLMFGFELECFMMDRNLKMPIGFTHSKQQSTNHYCSTSNCVNSKLQKFLNEVLVNGLEMGISLTGHNIEVAYGQIEFQVCNYGVDACHDLEVLKYLIECIGLKSEYNCYIDYTCKPLGQHHNGSGMHTNVSNKQMRENPNIEYTKSIVEKLGTGHEIAMTIYGLDNEKRLTGFHETSSFSKFTYASNSRAVSVRLQSKYNHETETIEDDPTYFEDRRPNSMADQYLVVSHIKKYAFD